MRPIDVVLLFDTEDVFSPPEVGNDDSILELATILEEEGLRGTFLFIGDRAQLLLERGRRDAIEALRRHEVGLHTRSALHPLSPEYTQRRGWEEGLEETLRREADGAELIARVFGQACCALSTHNVFGTPQSQRCAALLGLPYIYAYPAAPPRYSLSWYAGALGLPWWSPTLEGDRFLPYYDGFDSHYPDDDAFSERLAHFDRHVETVQEAGHPFMSLLLYHPQRVRLAEFIDSFFTLNGMNVPPEQWGRYGRPRRYTPEQTATALKNFRRLVRWIREDDRLRPLSVGDVVARYGHQPLEIARDELVAAARAIVESGQIPLHERFSPAEALLGMADALLAARASGGLPDSVRRRDVLGPTRNLIWYPEVRQLEADQLARAAAEVCDAAESTGHLPAWLGETGERIGVNHLHRAFAERVLTLEAGASGEAVALRPMPRYPAIGEKIGQRFLSVAEGRYLEPDLDVDALYRHGKLQSWTLKPAIFPEG